MESKAGRSKPASSINRSTSLATLDLGTAAPRARACPTDDAGEHPARLPQRLGLVPVLDHPRPLDELHCRAEVHLQLLLQPHPAPHAEMIGLDRDPRRRPAAQHVAQRLVVGALHLDRLQIRRRDFLLHEAVDGLDVPKVDDQAETGRLALDDRDAGARAQVEQVEKMRESRDDESVETPRRQLPP